MLQRKNRILLLILSVILFIFVLSLIWYLPPEFQISFRIFGNSIRFPIIYPFFILLSVFVISLGIFLFNNLIHSLLIGLFIIIYLLFQLNNLTDPFFLALLFAIFLFLDLFFSFGKQRVSRFKEKMSRSK